MRTSVGPTRRVRNIKASVFWRLLVIFPVGVAMLYLAHNGLFCGSDYAMAPFCDSSLL